MENIMLPIMVKIYFSECNHFRRKNNVNIQTYVSKIKEKEYQNTPSPYFKKFDS